MSTQRKAPLELASLRDLWAAGSSKTRKAGDVEVEDTLELDMPGKHSAWAGRIFKSEVVQDVSPWERYDGIYELHLGIGHRLIVASTKSSTAGIPGIVSIRRLPALQAIDLISIRHTNLLTTLDCFLSKEIFYVVSEHMPCSLHEARAIEYLDELRLAAIAGQILEGMSFLHGIGVTHGALSCSTIFLSQEGTIKIGELENLEVATAESKVKDIKALGSIVVDLMLGDHKDEERFCRWSASEAMRFATMANFATTIEELWKQDLFQRKWKAVDLEGLTNFSVAKERRGCTPFVE